MAQKSARSSSQHDRTEEKISKNQELKPAQQPRQRYGLKAFLIRSGRALRQPALKFLSVMKLAGTILSI